jgi:hypothetical protein
MGSRSGGDLPVPFSFVVAGAGDLLRNLDLRVARAAVPLRRFVARGVHDCDGDISALAKVKFGRTSRSTSQAYGPNT